MKAVLLALFVVIGFGAPAHAWWNLPQCDSSRVIGAIQQKFAYANRKTFHWGVGIDSVSDIRETPDRLHINSNIERRYCRGTAWLSNGRNSEVVYLIEAQQGFASIGWRVQSCLPAYDRWHVYGSWCRSIKP